MKVMSEKNLNGNNDDSDLESNIVRVVELGLAKLNTVSHHEHLRCAKLVNPLVKQLSKESNSTLEINRKSLIIEVEENEPEDDVYEDQMEIELESSLETALDTHINEESDNSLEGFESESFETVGDTTEFSDTFTHLNGQNTTSSNIKKEATLVNGHTILNDIYKTTIDTSNETVNEARSISSLNVNLDPGIRGLNKVSTDTVTVTQQDIISNSLTVLRSTEKINLINSEIANSMYDDNDDDDAEISEIFGGTVNINTNKDQDNVNIPETSGIIKTIDSEIMDSDMDDSEGTEQDAADTKVTEEEVKVTPEDIKKPEPAEENALKVNGTTEVKENGTTDEEVHFAEMNNYRQKFETGAVTENESTPKKVSVKEEYDEGGEFENTPIVNEDVVKETDQQKEELPEVGMAKNLLSKFKTLQEESSQTVTSQKRVSPPRNEKVEYENQPTERNIVYENKSDEGVFESTPQQVEDVVRSVDKAEDVQVEAGLTKNLLSKFKEIETESSAYKAREKRELTPDKSGKVEYVSEPRGEHITYEESKSETGVYENVPAEEEDVVRSADKAEEIMPESGMAQNLLSKFKQMESETANNPPPSPKRGKPYQPKPKEQKGYLERFSPKLEEGEFENEPHVPAEVVRSGDQQEDVKPESGAAKKTLEKFKEMEQQGSPPKAPDYRKDFTPPRETSPGKIVSGVLENEPELRPDVVRNADKAVDELPEQGTAKNILEKFKQIQSAENSPSTSPNKKYKEFTPPPEAGVYENVPKEHLVIEQRQSEVGVLESTPGKSVADIPREQREAMSPEAELPEKGMARNLVSKFKQLESESAKNSKSTSPKFKEFTPPRDTRNILSPKSPAEHQNGVHPSDLPEQYQEQTSPGIFESSPEVRKDVFREADTDWEQGLPAKNTTLSMVEKFRNIQQKAKDDEDAPSPVSKKDDSPSPPDHEEKGMFRVVQTEKCAACQKTVYAMEKLEMNGHNYHRNCFKCSHCSARLTPKTFSMNEGVIYCTNHFKQLFARKGNYDEGFGRQQYKKKWQDDKPKNEDSTASA